MPNADSGKLVKALVDNKPGKNLMAVGDWASMDDIAAIWHENTGLDIKVVRGTVEGLDQAIPGGAGKELGDMCEYMSSPGYYGGPEAEKALNLISPSDVSFCPSLIYAGECLGMNGC